MCTLDGYTDFWYEHCCNSELYIPTLEGGGVGGRVGGRVGGGPTSEMIKLLDFDSDDNMNIKALNILHETQQEYGYDTV